MKVSLYDGRARRNTDRSPQNKSRYAFDGPQRLPEYLAEWTGLEPATPGVTGRYSNQLNYHSAWPAALGSFEPQALPQLGVP